MAKNPIFTQVMSQVTGQFSIFSIPAQPKKMMSHQQKVCALAVNLWAHSNIRRNLCYSIRIKCKYEYIYTSRGWSCKCEKNDVKLRCRNVFSIFDCLELVFCITEIAVYLELLHKECVCVVLVLVQQFILI